MIVIGFSEIFNVKIKETLRILWKYLRAFLISVIDEKLVLFWKYIRWFWVFVCTPKCDKFSKFITIRFFKFRNKCQDYHTVRKAFTSSLNIAINFNLNITTYPTITYSWLVKKKKIWSFLTYIFNALSAESNK